jgi:hypothetical protein
LKLATFAAMSDYIIPPPEPKEIDEKLSVELRHLSSNAVLKGHPSGDEKCQNCLYYLEPTFPDVPPLGALEPARAGWLLSQPSPPCRRRLRQ